MTKMSELAIHLADSLGYCIQKSSATMLSPNDHGLYRLIKQQGFFCVTVIGKNYDATLEEIAEFLSGKDNKYDQRQVPPQGHAFKIKRRDARIHGTSMGGT